ncbi:MAG: hypothetical protein FWC80_03370 [Firmicutes bacterium]|nr:hypothetical protein [Bacillota bacterium]
MNIFHQTLANVSGDTQQMQERIGDLYRQLTLPLLGIFIGAALLLGLWLGLKFVFAGGDDQKQKKAKESVKFFVIGVVVIFVVAAMLPLAVGVLHTWATNQ